MSIGGSLYVIFEDLGSRNRYIFRRLHINNEILIIVGF